MTSVSLYVIPDETGFSTLLFHIRASHDGFHGDVMDSLRSAFATFKQGLAAKDFDVQPSTDFACSHIVAANPNWWTVQNCIDMDVVDYPEDINEIDQWNLMLDFCVDKIKSEALSSDIEYTITIKSNEKNPTWIVDYWDVDNEIDTRMILD